MVEQGLEGDQSFFARQDVIPVFFENDIDDSNREKDFSLVFFGLVVP